MPETWSGARLWGKQEEANAEDACASVGRAPPRDETLELNHREYAVSLSLAKQGVRYVGKGAHSTDVGAIQTSEPVPSSCGTYYYEMTILDSGACGYISLGFADAAFKLNRHCGYVTSTAVLTARRLSVPVLLRQGGRKTRTGTTVGRGRCRSTVGLISAHGAPI